MRIGYSDLQTFWTCPRKLGFVKTGWHLAYQSEAITVGLLTHTGVFAALRGQDANRAMAEQARAIKAASGEKDIAKSVNDAYLRAVSLASRYLAGYAKDYEILAVEPELSLSSVVCHPDLIVKFRGDLTIVDIKTSKQPDYRWYDISGQVDLYALVAESEYGEVVWCLYDVVSDEGIYRHQRPPRRSQGIAMGNLCQTIGRETVESLLIRPQPHFDCPSRCQYFPACWLLTTDSREAAEGWLIENMIQEGER